jgi:hypothetical protein
MHAKNNILRMLLCCCLILSISPIYAYSTQTIEFKSTLQNSASYIGNNSSNLIKNNPNTVTSSPMNGEKEQKGKTAVELAGAFSLSTSAFLWLYNKYGGNILWALYKISFTGGIISLFTFYAILFHPSFI